MKPGSVWCDVETDKATLAFENQEEGFVAALLVASGAREVPVGAPVAILVDDAGSIPAFANYSSPGAAVAAAPAPAPAATPAVAAVAAAAPPAGSFPPHQVGPPPLPTGTRYARFLSHAPFSCPDPPDPGPAPDPSSSPAP